MNLISNFVLLRAFVSSCFKSNERSERSMIIQRQAEFLEILPIQIFITFPLFNHGNAIFHQTNQLAKIASYAFFFLDRISVIGLSLSKRDRFVKLRNMAVRQIKALKENYTLGTIESPFVITEQYTKEQKQENKNEFDNVLEKIMKVPKPATD